MCRRLFVIFLYLVFMMNFVFMVACRTDSSDKSESTGFSGQEVEDSPMQPSAEIPLYDDSTDEGTPMSLKDNVYGVQFNCSAPILQIEIYISEAKTILGSPKVRVSVYKWENSYSKTIQNSPLFSIDKSASSESWMEIPVENSEGILPEGEYLLLFTTNNSGVELATVPSEKNNVCAYINGSTIGSNFKVRLKLKGEGVLSKLSGNETVAYTVSPDTWTVTDGLDREINVTYTDTTREGKYVGIFFHTWHSPRMHVHRGFMNITQILEAYDDLEINNYADARWGNAATYFWNEPIWGYYQTSDEWVLRRQAELLADAQIDVVFFDCTNGTELFLSDALALMKVWSEARSQGVKTPAVAFQLNMFNYDEAAQQLRMLYEEIYKPGLYKDLWFYWKGKPLVLAYPEHLSTVEKTDKEIREFFQYRVISHAQSQDGIQVQESDGTPIVMGNNSTFTEKGYQVWNWISAYPQIVNENPDGSPEQMAVSVSHNWCKETHLTAFSNQKDTVFSRDYIPTEDRYDDRENAKLYGAYFEAQWERALEIDPEFIFITGWNEWTAGRYEEYWGVTNAFIDNFTDARSRDIEPSKGDLKDHYYYQMVSYIRKFKGCSATPTQEEKQTIDIDNPVEAWDKATMTYASYAGDTFNRKCNGYKNAETGKYTYYEVTSGRNDLVSAKVAYDDNFVTFMVETAQDITPYTDNAWMRLFIEVTYADGKQVVKDNWESFQYMINRNSPESNTVTTLEASSGGWNWSEVGKVQYRVYGNRMFVQIPRKMLGIESGDFILNFKWSDNMQTDGDIMDFYTHGDVAPGGRFKYQFVAGKVNLPENPADHSVITIVAVLGALGAVLTVAIFLIIRKKRNKIHR